MLSVLTLFVLTSMNSAAPLWAAEPKADRKKPASMTPRNGVKTPGVAVPFSKLKAEAEIALPGVTPGILFSDSIYITQTGKDGIARIDPKTNKPAESLIPATRPCAGLVEAFNSIWSPSCDGGVVNRIDTKSGKVTATVAAGSTKAVAGIAATADSIWMFTDDKVTLSRIDPDLNKVVAETRLPASCNSMVFGENALWVTCAAENKVLRIDTQTNLVDKRIDVAAGPRSLAIAEGSLWVLCETEGKVARIDPKLNKVIATIDLAIPNSGGEITSGASFVWVSAAGFPLTRIDPATDKVVQQFYGDGGDAVRFGQNSLWLFNTKQGSVWRVDPRRVLATFPE